MARGDTTRRRWLVSAALLLLAGLSVLVAPSSGAQVLPDLPPLPAPPADGNLLADILGPASATACDAVATVYGLAGPIAAAQLPPELQALLTETDPYLALVTYGCGYLAVPPSGVICASDQSTNQLGGSIGAPVALPAASQIFYDTAAGIEHAMLRLGVDIGTDASRQLAAALGCGVPPPVDEGDAAALPLTPAAPSVDLAPTDAPSGFRPPSVPAIVSRPANPGSTTELPGALGQLGALRYPVKEAAALLLALPLVLLAVAVAFGPRVTRRGRRHRDRFAASGTGT
jgi:hypothetical protein